MTAPRWARALVGRLADRPDEAIGDLDEAHRVRIERHGRILAAILTCVEAIDMAWALRRSARARPLDLGSVRRRWMPPFSWLDFKLGLRMLARYPGMTAVSVTAMAFGIALGAGCLHIVREMWYPKMPYANKERIVAIQKYDRRTGGSDDRTLRDFVAWRERLTSIGHLAARQVSRHNLSADGAESRAVRTAAVSAVAFSLAPVPPELGRPLVPADESADASPVAVLSDEIWRSVFGGDPAVVGRSIRLGRELFTVVGVMPPDFRLYVPSNDLFYLFEEDLWIPFRLDPLAYPPGEGPLIDVFGQLAPGVTAEEAEAELVALGLDVEASPAEAYRHLVPNVLSFADPFGQGAGIRVSTALVLCIVFVVLIMTMLCANVALMMYARAATRESEIVVRSALGASRARVVGQLFVEALAIAALAIGVGLLGATWGVRWIFAVFGRVASSGGEALPSIDLSLSSTTMVSAAALALVGAVIAGVVPGLKVTAGASPGLPRQAGRGGGARLGRAWSAIIVVQVGITVAVIPWGGWAGMGAWQASNIDLGFAADEYLTARLDTDEESLTPPDDPAFRARYEAAYSELARQVTSEPGVSGVTLADAFPALYHRRRFVEVDSPDGPVAVVESIQIATVEPSFFGMFGAEIVAGRGFDAMDLAPAVRTVVVNESFVRDALGGTNAVGRRIRYPSVEVGGEEATWLEIVGVTEDLDMYTEPFLPSNAGVYHPLGASATYPLRIAVHLPRGAAEFVPRLREITADVAPELRLFNPMSLDRASDGHVYSYGGVARFFAVAGALAILLTNAGIYAIVSFTVSRRTREIGVRVALGAHQRQIAWAVMAGMAKRVGLGIALGAVLSIPLTLEVAASRTMGPVGWVLAGSYLVLMVGGCMAACVVPLRRALSIQPSEALASDG